MAAVKAADPESAGPWVLRSSGSTCTKRTRTPKVPARSTAARATSSREPSQVKPTPTSQPGSRGSGFFLRDEVGWAMPQVSVGQVSETEAKRPSIESNAGTAGRFGR
jgi:hypothetical protein